MVLNLKAQISNLPSDKLTALNIDSNKVTLFCDRVFVQKPNRNHGRFEYRYDAYNGTYIPVYVPGSYNYGSRSYTVEYYSFSFGYNERQSFGIVLKNLNPYLSKYVASKGEYQLAKKYAKGNMFCLAAEIIGCGIILNSLINPSLRGTGFDETKKLIFNYGIPIVLIGGSYLLSNNYKKKKMKHFEEAVKLYNQELVNLYNQDFIERQQKGKNNEFSPPSSDPLKSDK